MKLKIETVQIIDHQVDQMHIIIGKNSGVHEYEKRLLLRCIHHFKSEFN